MKRMNETGMGSSRKDIMQQIQLRQVMQSLEQWVRYHRINSGRTRNSSPTGREDHAFFRNGRKLRKAKW